MTARKINLREGGELVCLKGSKPITHALILLHGRGASALDILHITHELAVPEQCVIVAPEAPEHTWYPQRFTEPKQTNEPALSNSLSLVNQVCEHLYETYDLAPTDVTLAGFSQGACLIAEFLKQSPKQYHAAALFSGGLLGTDAEATATISGTFSQTPLYVGCDEEDFHIPKERVVETAAYFTEHEARVILELYKNFGHRIHPHGLAFIEKHLAR